VGRADGARVWARVLSELAAVPVTVEWERPAWRVSWRDGPTRRALMDRAAALGGYRVGAPLAVEGLRFVRGNSASAVALAWLTRGSPTSAARAAAAVPEVRAWCEDTGYPQSRFDGAAVAAADLLAGLGRGDPAEMGALLAGAVPAVPAHGAGDPGPELTGRVTGYSWPAGGPPDDLLGPAPRPARAAAVGDTPAVACQRCGRPLQTSGSGRGRPARYCSGACRVAAHRARHRTPSAPAAA